MSAVALAMLWWAAAHVTAAAGADSTDTFSAGAPLYAYFREARGGESLAAQRINSFDEIRRRAHDHAHVSFEREADQPARLIAGTTARVHEQVRAHDAQYRRLGGSASVPDAPIDASFSDLLVRLHYAFGCDPGLSSDRAPQNEGEVLLRNADAFMRTKVQLIQSSAWRGFVYADIGATDSELRWQGLAGVHARLGVDLLGGWRHVTYHFSPGRGFDSLDFNGPFLGAAAAW